MKKMVMGNLSLKNRFRKSGDFSPFLYKSWMIWACAAFFYGYQFMLRVSPSVMADDLMVSFQVDACSLGMLSAFYYYAYSSLQIPVGSLIDYFKPRRILTFAAISCACGTLVFSTADSLYVAALGRALIGAGSAVAFLSCLKLGTLWFPSSKLPLVVGMSVFLGTMGATSAGAPMAWLVQGIGWRSSLWIVAFIGFGVAALSWIMVRDSLPEKLKEEILKTHKGPEEPSSQSGFLLNILQVTKNPQTWLIALYGFLLYIPLSGFADLWGTSFLMVSYSFDKQTAANTLSFLYIGVGIGAPLFSFLCKKLKAYKLPIFITAFGSFLSLSIVIYLPYLPYPLLVLFFPEIMPSF